MVKLDNPKLVQKIISKKRKFKRLVFSHLDIERYKSLNKFKKRIDYTIYINESLSQFYKNLKKKAQEKLKLIKFNKIWQSNGCIYAQFAEDLLIYQILSENDVLKLLGIYGNEKT